MAIVAQRMVEQVEFIAKSWGNSLCRQHWLNCLWHHFQYGIRTGENLYPRRVYPLES